MGKVKEEKTTHASCGSMA